MQDSSACRAPRRTRRLTAALAALALTVGLITAVRPLTAAAAPPPNPTDGQISAAQQKKQALAATVGRYQAQVAEMQSQLNQLNAAVESAAQKVALTRQKLEQAKQAATTARAKVHAAQHGVVQAQRDFDGYIQAMYTSGSIQGTTGALLTADDPNVLLQQGTFEKYQASHQLNAIGTLQRATVAKSNADAEARVAVQKQESASKAAEQAAADARAAYAAAQAQKQRLDSKLAANQERLDKARLQLATLNHQRKTFQAYQREQARLAEIRRQQELERERQREAALQHQQNGGSTPSPQPTSPPSGGSWSAAKGQTAVARAAHWLGMPYIWAGGNSIGPTDGGCTDPIAPCGVVGFDCSGLTLNAWAPYISLAHFANTQYFQAGRFHPSPGQFMPGDLLFWGNPGASGGLHHVAIYAGNGNVIQAPESGDVVRYTPWNQVSYDYYGATRPLS